MTMHRLMHGILRWCAYLCAMLSLTSALALSAARWWLPQVSQYKTEIEALVTGLIKQPVRIETIEAGMTGFTPRIMLKNLHILSADGHRTLVMLQRAWIDIGIISSALNQQITPSTLGVDHVRIGLARMRDGRLRVLGIEDSENESDTRKIVEWALNQKFLEIRHSDVMWRDYMSDEDDWYFNDLNVRLHSHGDNHEIFGSTSLPLEIGYRGDFAARIQGDPTLNNAWQADVFVAARGIRLGRWLQDHAAGGFNLHEGRADTHLWSHWAHGQIDTVSGEFLANNLTLSNAAKTRARQFDALSGRVAVARSVNGWRIALDQLHVTQAQENWPTAQLRLGIENTPDKHQTFGSISVLRADHAAQLASLSDAWANDDQHYLSGAQPQGMLLDNAFYIEKISDKYTFVFQGRMQNFGFRPLERLPGAYGVNARYVLTPQRGRVDLDAQDATFAYPTVFSEPLNIQNITGSVFWATDENALRVWTSTLNAHNADVSLFGHVDLTFPKDAQAPPWIDLAARFNNTAAAHVGRYLPINALSKNVIEWIRHACVGGSFPNGELLYFGPLKTFPYEKGDGRFELRTQIKDVILDYARGWPLITGINGELVYDGNQLKVAAHEGRIFKNRLSDTVVEIPKFSGKTVWLNVRGHAEGESAEKLKFLHESPLEAGFAKALAPFNSTGRSDLDLALSIPLSGDATTLVKGGLQLHNNHITAPEYDLDFTRADGTVFFSEKSVTGRQLRAYMNDRVPLSVHIDTDDSLGYRAIRLSGDTTITQGDVQELFTRYLHKGHWADYLAGGTPVKMGVNIPIDKNSNQAPTLSISSSLNGMAVRLPLPAAKPATGERKLEVEMQLSGPERILRTNYGDTHILLQFRAVQGELHLQRGALAVQSEPKLPSENAIHFIGHANYLSWPEWTAVLFPPAPKIPLIGEGSGPHLTLYFNARIDNLDAYGNRFQNVSLQASEAAQGYSVHINSDQASGTLFIPEFVANTPLVIDMERLFWTTGESGGEATGRLDPHELPSMRISAKAFRVDNTNFGTLELNAERVEQGLRLSKLSLQNPITQINATGTWLGQYGHYMSRFNIETKTKDVGKMLEGFRYTGGIRGGTGQLTITAGWLGSPFDFSLEKLDGTIKLLIDDGRLLEIDPGAARMFGLLSLQALPRRFTLDFSDMFATGMTFDHIVGEFSVTNGDAYTGNLIMDSPSSLIKIAGRVGLARRDYDQDITVVPHVGESIPIIGTALTGPTIGAALLVLQKLFEKQIQAVSTVHYKITGPWDNPSISKISKDHARSNFTIPVPPAPMPPQSP
ncbi:MAG: YhdP family protein [Pseudomonadota bacterium]